MSQPLRRIGNSRAHALFSLLSLASLTLAHTPTARGDGPFFRRTPAQSAPVYAPTSIRLIPASSATNSYGRLGSFYPTPYLMVRGNAPAGGGYSPLGSFGDSTLSLYGPLSSFRSVTAPVWTYSRGYDGQTVMRPGTSVSTPNEPSMTNVVYPTRSTYYYGFRDSGSPPWFANGINWIDQN